MYNVLLIERKQALSIIQISSENNRLLKVPKSHHDKVCEKTSKAHSTFKVVVAV